MAKKIPCPFVENDRVRLVSWMSSIPAYGGKPFVGHDTVLIVKEIRGTGSKRNPWQVLAAHAEHDVEGMRWYFDPAVLEKIENHPLT